MLPIRNGLPAVSIDLQVLIHVPDTKAPRVIFDDESVFHKCEEEALKRAEMRLRRQAAHLGFRIIPAEEG